MKKLSGILIGLVALCAVFVGKAPALEVNPLGVEEMARWGATHRVTITHDDLTDTNLATLSAQTITNIVIPANASVVPICLVVDAGFNINAATTNAYNSTTLSIGDSSSNTAFVSSTQINGNGTNVVLKTPAIVIPKNYTAANNLSFAFTAMTNQTLDAFTRGQVRFYYKLISR